MSKNLSAWERVQMARRLNRTRAKEYIDALFTDFMELHGDRLYGDDPALLAGIGFYDDQPVTILAQCKGKTLEENVTRNFGMMNPEGYRKALRLARQAEKFSRPIVTFVDTSGAYPGIGAEERGQASAIAECLEVFSGLETPVICFVIGEGGSGGALALSVADKIYMLENAVYSALSPEGFASILWKDGSRVQEAAEVMELTARDLYHKGVVDAVIDEPEDGVEICPDFVYRQMRNLLSDDLKNLSKKRKSELTAGRYQKFRKIGV